MKDTLLVGMCAEEHINDLQDTIGAVEEAASMEEAPSSRGLDLDLDEDIVRDLGAEGIAIGEEAQYAQAQRDAMASFLMRRAARLTADLASKREAMRQEVAIITGHYDRLTSGLAQQLARIEEHVQYLAEISAAAGGFGKKKSASLPHGVYGFRDVAAAPELVDEAVAIAGLAADESLANFVTVTAKLPLGDAREYFNDDELSTHKQTLAWGELKKLVAAESEAAVAKGAPYEPPAGVRITPASREFYAKPKAAA